MADKPKEGGGNIIIEGINLFFGLVVEMLSALAESLPKVLKILGWVLAGVLILPCVFVAGAIYPKWVEWGEGM